MTFSELHKIIKAVFPEISQEQLSQFEAMEALYKEWNSKINVISRKDIDSFYEHHVLHSLAIAAYLRYNLPSEYDLLSAGKSNQPSVHPDQKAELGAGQGTLSVLDLGTGGGFP
ncbi:MAG: class I SAM-dependent methyltransferase, partial [Bacteroidales bacterium]|nr:class I SAM-dependent methyltransferase [Bacteroidales bacterium]